MNSTDTAFFVGLLVGAVLVPVFWGGLLLGISYLAEFIAAARDHRRTRIAQMRWEAQQRFEAAQFEAEIRADLRGKPFPDVRDGHAVISRTHVVPKVTVK